MRLETRGVPGRVTYYSYGDGEVQVGEFQLHRATWNGNPEYSIWAVEIYPPYRGLGHGREMMQLALAQIKSEGGTGAMLWVKSDNETAVRLYESLGFKVKAATQQPINESRMEVSL